MTITTIIQANPTVSILLFSFLVTVFITIISYYFTDRNLMKEIKERQKALKEEMKKYKDNPSKMMELNKQMMADFPKQMKQSLKVSLITIIPMIFLFNWLQKIYAGSTTHWLATYIISSIVFSIVLRKLFKLD